MSRQLSLYALLGTVALIGVVFYQVIQPFIVSLLFATVLAVLFRPAYLRLAGRLGDHHRIAALLTTVAVMLLVLLPIGGALVLAAAQMADVAHEMTGLLNDEQDSKLKDELDELEESRLAKSINRFYHDLPDSQRQRIDKLVAQAGDGFAKRVYEKTANFVGDLVNFLIGIVVTGLAMYYLLADGDTILRLAKDFVPLDEEEQQALIKQYGVICRAVVLGTVVAALAQAILAGAGYVVAGVPNALLLVVVTMFFAFIPFIGASSVVVLVAGWLALEGRYGAAGGLFFYCISIIAVTDNLIRAYVIGNEAKMNPLIAFITVLGAIQLIGLLGIFVGPMIAALFYTLLKLLRRRIVREEAASPAN